MNLDALDAGDEVSVKSSNVSTVRYEAATSRLFVRFVGGSLYAYDDVPRDVAVGLITADSPGRFVWDRIRDRFPYRKVG